MKKMKIFLVIIWFLLLMTSLAYNQSSPRYYWKVYVVDNNSPIGACSSLQFDSEGFPHIAYRGMSNMINGSMIKYAVYNGTTWNFKVINPFPRAQGRVAMDLDNSDHPHIIYHTNDGEYLNHIYFDGIFWSEEKLVDEPLSDYYWINIKIDSNNIVKMVYPLYYTDFSRNRISYKTFNGVSYGATQLIDNHEVWSGKWSSLTLDSQDKPHVAYWLDSEDLVYAYLDQNVWKTEVIDSTGFASNQGFYPTILLGKDQNFYISFQNHTSKKLRLAKGTAGNWNVEDIIDLKGWTTFTTPSPMVLDNADNPHIAFFDFNDNTLKLTYQMNDTWYTEVIDTSQNCGYYASLALTPEGLPAVSYLDDVNGYLKYAVAQLSPLPDSDGDGLPDYLEIALGTNILDLDSDDDGISDFDEDANRNGLIEDSETSPLKFDTDGDALSDGLELGYVNGIVAPPGLQGTNPDLFQPDLDPSTTTNAIKADSDRDSLSDGNEDFNKNGREDSDETNPNNPDTDGDLLPDGLEISMVISPLDLDSDDDGISDSDEDSNRDGIWDPVETSPALYDSDSDSLPDGLEMGVSLPIPDPDGSGKLLGTDMDIFKGDQDPATQTDPLFNDSDGDNLIDGKEDLNINGRFDDQETDPLDPDSDNDQLEDSIERLAGSDPLDLDTDDDGIGDNFEDENLNGIVDSDETSPLLFDTDGDLLSDGVENGVTEGIPDPDGQGFIKGTNLSVFMADQDPEVNTNPLIWDTDEDGLADGEEDLNFNGAVEVGETHFLVWDTDSDSLADGDEISFNSDPLDNESKAEIDTIIVQKFYMPPIPKEWIVVDEGNIDSPSNWFIYGDALTQGSGIYGGDVNTGGEDPHKPGTFIFASHISGGGYKIKFEMLSANIGSLGAMFNYSDANNYYRFSMNQQKAYRRVTKKIEGEASVIALEEFSYVKERFYEIIVFTVNGRLQIYIDKIRIFDLQDNSLPGGSFAFYSWNNPISMFKNLTIVGYEGSTHIEIPSTSNITSFTVSNDNSKGIISWTLRNNPMIYSLELYREEQGNYVLLEDMQVMPSETGYIESGYVDSQPWLAEKYKLVLYSQNNQILEEKLLLNSPAQITEFSITEPYPNPSRDQLNLVLQSPENVLLRFQIYDVLGRRVREFETTQNQKSWKQVVWDGRDAQGKLVSKGIYIVQVQAVSMKGPRKVLWQDVKKVARIK